MVVEDQRGTLDGDDGDMDWCPVGMRVLAVDDDPVSLKLLNQLLLSCQYQVTTTNQAIEALEILRQERNKFDLVISDVNMPEMDGFKLLELLRIEMDLPVIMLSGHDDSKLVMKGICYGACAYLLKPIRIEELKTIWQHVVRRKIFDSKDQNKSLHKDKSCHVIGEGGQGLSPTGSSGQNDKLHKKRKYPNEDEEEEEGNDDKHENEGPPSHKKPRVVWSEELREKFIAAVIQLGPKDAVPKKILEVMNVEGLSRENVASHLQKYRNNLKRNSCVETQQAALGGKDTSNMHIGLHNGFGDLHSAGSGRLSNAALSSYTPGGLLGRLNSPSGLSIQGITSSGLGQPGFQPAVPANQCPNSFQAITTSLELNQLKQSKCTSHIAEPNPNNDPKSYTILSRLRDTRVSGSSIQSDSRASHNPLMLQGNPQLTDITGVFGNPSSLRVALLNPEAFDLGICGSSEILDHNLCSERLEGSIQLSRFPSDALPMSELFNHGQLHANNLGVSSSWPQIGNTPNDFSSIRVLSAPVEQLRGDIQNQEGLVGNAIPTMNYAPKKSWEEHKRDYSHNLSLTFSAINSLVSANGIVDPLSQSLNQNNAVCCKQMNSYLFNQLNGVTTIIEQPSEIEKSAIETNMQSSEDCLLEQTKLHDGFIQNSYESLNDIMSVRPKRGQNENMLPDGEFGFYGH